MTTASVIRSAFLRYLVTTLCTLAVALCSAMAMAQTRKAEPDWNEKDIKWLSYESGLQEAATVHKPIFAVFYTDWCPHCTGYSRLFQDPQVVEISRSLIMVKINSDTSPQINSRYAQHGRYVPRTMVLNPDGELIASIQGGNPRHKYFIAYENRDELLAVMKRAAAILAR